MSDIPLRVRTDTDFKNPYIKPADLIEYLDNLMGTYTILNHSERARTIRWLIADVNEAVKNSSR